MSYDVYFEIDSGEGDPEEVAWRNYTSNVSSMWRRAIERSGASPDLTNLGDLIEATPAAAELGEIVAVAWHQMREDGPGVYADLEPLNHWGNYTGALGYLEWISEMCAKYPECRVRVWR